MRLSIGIVGLPNVGKSTLFNALTDAGVLVANYPFATIDRNTGVVPIPDPRLEQLAEIFGSRRIVPATVTFVDIAGLVEGASRGEGLGNQFLAHIRDVSAICHVVRTFESESVAHVAEALDPARDIETVETELALADLETIEKEIGRLEKRALSERGLAPRVELLGELREIVGSGEMLSKRIDLMARRAEYADLNLLTSKPIVYVFNADETVLGDEERRRELTDLVAPGDALFIDAQLESELMELPADERIDLLRSIGQEELGLDGVIKAAYHALGLQSFLTGREKETRAWTIRSGTTARDAAGEIHTDLERGFIAAEVIDFDLLAETGSWQAARSEGLLRTEGKDYVMRPNDVVEFRFNV